ncbi:MAG: Acg family FMN-binding oxidoreductase, partial [Kineosporiaceae bacterium]
AIGLYADRTRALPVNDPHDRELTISCGAALYTLCLSARVRALAPRVTTLPGDDPDLLALVELLGGGSADERDQALLAACPVRRTVRAPFSGRPVPADLVRRLGEAVAAEGAWLEIVGDDPRRTALAELVAEGDAMQFADPSWRRELASWMHPRRRGEGLVVPIAALPIARLVVSALDLGTRTGAKDAALLEGSPVVAVLGTDGDATADWLDAGRALQSALLTAAAEGVHASYLNQPCQVGELRPRLADLLERPGLPQLVLRFGFPAQEGRPAPRRPVSAVVEE